MRDAGSAVRTRQRIARRKWCLNAKLPQRAPPFRIRPVTASSGFRGSKCPQSGGSFTPLLARTRQLNRLRRGDSEFACRSSFVGFERQRIARRSMAFRRARAGCGVAQIQSRRRSVRPFWPAMRLFTQTSLVTGKLDLIRADAPGSGSECSPRAPSARSVCGAVKSRRAYRLLGRASVFAGGRGFITTRPAIEPSDQASIRRRLRPRP